VHADCTYKNGTLRSNVEKENEVNIIQYQRISKVCFQKSASLFRNLTLEQTMRYILESSKALARTLTHERESIVYVLVF
jgi:hypothetical protein